MVDQSLTATVHNNVNLNYISDSNPVPGRVRVLPNGECSAREGDGAARNKIRELCNTPLLTARGSTHLRFSVVPLADDEGVQGTESRSTLEIQRASHSSA